MIKMSEQLTLIHPPRGTSSSYYPAGEGREGQSSSPRLLTLLLLLLVGGPREGGQAEGQALREGGRGRPGPEGPL